MTAFKNDMDISWDYIWRLLGIANYGLGGGFPTKEFLRLQVGDVSPLGKMGMHCQPDWMSWQLPLISMAGLDFPFMGVFEGPLCFP